MPLSVSGLPLTILLIFVSVALVGVLGATAGHLYLRFSSRLPFVRSAVDVETRHCRYCYFGRAMLRDESARVEVDELVEVKCFVCSTCGLPQWSVMRSAVLKRAA